MPIIPSGDPLVASRWPADIEERLRVLEATRRIWPVYSLPTSPTPGQAVDSGITILVGSATFTEVWFSRVPGLIGPALDLGFYVYQPAGVQAEIRVVIDHPDGTYTTAALTTAVGTDAFRAITTHWLHGATLGPGPCRIGLQVRKVAGAFDAYVYQPVRFVVRDPETATTAPDWSDLPYP